MTRGCGENERGFATLETVVGLALMLMTFAGLLEYSRVLSAQVRTEEIADDLAFGGARSEVPAGTRVQRELPSVSGRATLVWAEQVLRVRVEIPSPSRLLGGTLTATRTVPRG